MQEGPFAPSVEGEMGGEKKTVPSEPVYYDMEAWIPIYGRESNPEMLLNYLAMYPEADEQRDSGYVGNSSLLEAIRAGKVKVVDIDGTKKLVLTVAQEESATPMSIGQEDEKTGSPVLKRIRRARRKKKPEGIDEDNPRQVIMDRISGFFDEDKIGGHWRVYKKGNGGKRYDVLLIDNSTSAPDPIANFVVDMDDLDNDIKEIRKFLLYKFGDELIN